MYIYRDDCVVQHRIVDHDRLVHDKVLAAALINVALVVHRLHRVILVGLVRLHHLYRVLLGCLLRLLNGNIEESGLLCVVLLIRLSLSRGCRHQVHV